MTNDAEPLFEHLNKKAQERLPLPKYNNEEEFIEGGMSDEDRNNLHIARLVKSTLIELLYGIKKIDENFYKEIIEKIT